MAIEFNDRRKTKKEKPHCEVCWAGKEGYNEDTPLYRHGGSIYCEQDLDRALSENWHPGVNKVTEIKGK